MQADVTSEATAAALRSIRQHSGMSLSGACLALGWNFRRLQRIELGLRLPTYAEVVELLDLYRAAWAELRAAEAQHERKDS